MKRTGAAEEDGTKKRKIVNARPFQNRSERLRLSTTRTWSEKRKNRTGRVLLALLSCAAYTCTALARTIFIQTDLSTRHRHPFGRSRARRRNSEKASGPGMTRRSGEGAPPRSRHRAAEREGRGEGTSPPPPPPFRLAPPPLYRITIAAARMGSL